MTITHFPRPQFIRNDWQSLDGAWQFAFDDDNKGLQEHWFKGYNFPLTINVPFAYQTERSGVHDPSFHDVVWYERTFDVPSDWNERVVLHFNAVDYETAVYVNDQLVGTHIGGQTPFSFDITDVLNHEAERVSVRVFDPSTDETIPRGKQFWQEAPDSIWYTRTTGIWQSVWLEHVPHASLQRVRMTPDLDQGEIRLAYDVSPGAVGLTLETEISFQGELVSSEQTRLVSTTGKRAVNVLGPHIFHTNFHHDGRTWTPENPNLFDIVFRLKDGERIVDEVTSYFGMRKIHTEGGMFYLNNKPYYQKLVLDQGYWRESLLTPPSDDALKRDIELAKEMGFNGCRKHQKVEDPRFLYWADHLGYLVWGESAASAFYTEDAAARLTREWIEIVERDYNHPSIVAWVPLNESWGIPLVRSNAMQQHHSQAMYHLIHSIDGTRPVISNDGWELTVTDLCAIHNYNHGQADETEKYEVYKQDLATIESLLTSQPARRRIYANGFSHQGEPILLTEFGGIGYKIGGDAGWGYTSVSDGETFVKDYARIMDAVYASRALHGYCYTQLTDVEQEINGLLTYDREPKVPLETIRQINDQWHHEIR